jgi:hypothetical protein
MWVQRHVAVFVVCAFHDHLINVHFVLNARVRFNVVRRNNAKKSVTVFYGEMYLEKYSLGTYVR